MNSHELWEMGVIEDRAALLVALVEAEWPKEDAERLLDRLVKTSPRTGPRGWRRWTDDELAVIHQAIKDNDGFLPSSQRLRELGAQLGRGPRAVHGRALRMGYPARNPRPREPK